MQGGLRPLGERILVERSDGIGQEVTLPSGIVLPATRESSVRTKADYFRARVLAMGDEARRTTPDLSDGDEVLVYAYAGTADKVFTGDATAEGLFIRPDDVICVVEGH